MWSAQVQFIWLPIKPQAWILTVITLVRDRFEFIVVQMCLKVKKKKKKVFSCKQTFWSRTNQDIKVTNKQTNKQNLMTLLLYKHSWLLLYALNRIVSYFKFQLTVQSRSCSRKHLITSALWCSLKIVTTTQYMHNWFF